MKRRFYQIAKKLNSTILNYKSYRSIGMGGLQVFELRVGIGNGKILLFDDSYFHLSGDAPKVLIQFEKEIMQKQYKTNNNDGHN